jgi:predicted phage-related endonuclease
MGASLDGIDKSRRIIVEIKCPEISGHQAALNKEIPPMYKDQMQHQLYATEADMCFYVTYNEQHEQKLSILKVPRDEKFMQNMVDAELEFYEEFLCKFKKPPLIWRYKNSA